MEPVQVSRGYGNSVGERLKSWRKQSGMTLMDVSALIGVSQSALSEMENDKSLPSAVTLTGLCLKTDLNIYWLLTGKESRDNKKAGAPELEAAAGVPFRLDDTRLRGMVERLVRVYRSGDSVKNAHLDGFLRGADPGA